MDNTHSFDLIVIGAGVAGLAAAREAARSGARVALLESQIFGGLVINVNELDGAITGSGAEYASNLMNEAMELGAVSIDTEVTSVRPCSGGFTVATPLGDYSARTVIAASGATRRKLGVPGEQEFEHRGVSHCADCDGPLYHGQEVVVVGGGDGALQSALSLANYCSRVHLVHRAAQFRARIHFVDRVRTTPNIQVHLNAEVSEITGGDKLEAVRMGDQTLPCSGFFAYVGLEPATSILPPEVERDGRGAAITSATFESRLPGLFVVGAARAGYGGALEQAALEGEEAARAAVARVRPAQAA
jgi:thioredoxin reductase (NADPH)